MNPKRIRLIKVGEEKSGPVIYWMSRDQRVKDNWALIASYEEAMRRKRQLIVVFCTAANFLEATARQYLFMIGGLKEVEKEFKRLNIPFAVLTGNPGDKIPEFIKESGAGVLYTDFDPLKIKREWKDDISQKINIPFYEIDAHNIVPCFHATAKEEFGAYTFRPKIQRVIAEYLDEFSQLKKMRKGELQSVKNNWEEIVRKLKIDSSIGEVDWIMPGEKAAGTALEKFLFNKIKSYSSDRNDPVKDGQSNLSPYIHFGQISAQRIVLEVEKIELPVKDKESFLEELIVRRELADNFCYYNINYDSFEGFKPWAKRTLNDHRKDKREFVYSLKEFEKEKTHEDLWNAAQSQLTNTGKMHGYMRMYWAKKILEWSETPEEALRIAIYLNDKYELDGRDPNGYTGCAWAIGGVHDRAWSEREVFGKIRYMNRNGCKRKFDIEAYIEKYKRI